MRLARAHVTLGPVSVEGGTKAVVAALAANLFIAVSKFGAWLLTGASSLLAEAIHSLADSGNQGLLLLGGKAAKREPDAEHPFGYGRERYVYAFIVSIVLFSVGGLFALYEAYHKWEEVHHGRPNGLLESSWWWVPIAVLVGAIIAESFSFRTAIIETNAVRGEQSFARFVRTAKSPELPVILLEDLAALLGLVVALVGVGLTLLTGNGYWDAAGTACIGLLLVAVAIILAIEMKSLLIGESATPASISKIRAGILSADGVEQIIHLKTLHLGPEEVLVTAKIGVDAGDSAHEVAAIIDRAEAAVRAAAPMVSALYLEPDIYRSDCRPAPGPPVNLSGDEHPAQ